MRGEGRHFGSRTVGSDPELQERTAWADSLQTILDRRDHTRGVHHHIKAPTPIEVLSTCQRLGRPKFGRLFTPGLVRLNNRYRSGPDPLSQQKQHQAHRPSPVNDETVTQLGLYKVIAVHGARQRFDERRE